VFAVKIRSDRGKCGAPQMFSLISMGVRYNVFKTEMIDVYEEYISLGFSQHANIAS